MKKQSMSKEEYFLKDIQKVWKTIAQDHIKIYKYTYSSLEANYKDMMGVLRFSRRAVCHELW